jgi:hypothetical protein
VRAFPIPRQVLAVWTKPRISAKYPTLLPQPTRSHRPAAAASCHDSPRLSRSNRITDSSPALTIDCS